MKRRAPCEGQFSAVATPGAGPARAVAWPSTAEPASADAISVARSRRLLRRPGAPAPSRVPLVAETGLIADADGAIVQCDPALATALGYPVEELLGMPVGELLPELSGVRLLADGLPDPRLSFLCHCDARFRAIASRGRVLASRLAMSRIGEPGSMRLRIIVRDACAEAVESPPR